MHLSGSAAVMSGGHTRRLLEWKVWVNASTEWK